MRKFNITVNGSVYEVTVEEVSADSVTAAPAAPAVQAAPKAPAPAQKPAVQSGAAGSVKVTAPMPGNILKVSAEAGKAVKKGDLLCVLEAMKMENEIFAPSDGVVATVNVKQGAAVTAGTVLFTLS